MGEFYFKEDHQYSMPAHFGGHKYETSTTIYRDVTNLVVRYRTDKRALEAFIPDAFEIADPVIAIAFVMNRGVEWMAGGSYNLVGVNVPVKFDGEVDHVEGGFAMVVWENKCTPILPGRERTGIPKIPAGIEDARNLRGHWLAEASYEGNTFLEIQMEQGDAIPSEMIAEMNEQNKEGDWLGWRYIPKVSGPGWDISEPVTYPQGSVVKEAWTAKAEVSWTALPWEKAPTQAHILKAMASLPVLEMEECFITKGESILIGDNARVLR